MTGIFTAFGLGFLYFISAIPGGVAAHAPVWLAATAAWLGYSAGGLVVLAAGAPLRTWITRKMKIDPTPDPTKLFWKVWGRFGLWGLGLIAPVTVGPQVTAVIALALGESPRRIQLAIFLGVLPWVIALGLLTALGAHAFK
jgi:membrane protein YqaA with SNARE-associated domain